jgi:pimeloyl-ACP methyl ester carboxylesterase
MNILQIWPLLETIVILAIFGFVLFRMWRTMKARAKNPPSRPTTRAGWLKAGSLYVSRLVGWLVGSLLALTLFIMIERNVLLVILDTAPARSEVNIPADLGLDVEEVTFESTDGLTMAGWYVPPKNGAVIILLHGYGGNRTSMIWHAGQLVQAGYGVLMYDERASGESGGGHRSYGWEDTNDSAGALLYLASRTDAGNQVGIMGCSTGADIALRSMFLNPGLGAAWADGSSMVRAQDLPAPTNLLTALMHPGQRLYDWLLALRLGIVPPPPLTEVLDKISPRPLMFVGGGMERPLIGSEADLFTRREAALAGSNAQVWVIPEATHCDGPRVQPEEYAARMVAFFDAAFAIKR